MPTHPRHFIGVMSGTSMDGLEVCLVADHSGDIRALKHNSIDFPSSLKQQLHRLAESDSVTLDDVGTCDVTLARFISTAVNDLITESGISKTDISAIGSHGQTIFHRTQEPSFSWQIGNPSIIAQETGLITIADFRMADIAANGQGAPLAPAFHLNAFRSNSENRVILNLGGIANITLLPSTPEHPPIGFDTGPANTLMDRWINLHLGEDYDDSGDWARTGLVNTNLLTQLLSEPFFTQKPPKSTGRELFNLNWLETMGNIEALRACDVQRTLLELTAKSIADAIADVIADAIANAHETPEENHGAEPTSKSAPDFSNVSVYACGGGAKNTFLMERIAAHCGHSRISTTADLGIPPEQVEAAAFAWLAAQTLDRKPGNLPSVTGSRRKKVMGGIYYP